MKYGKLSLLATSVAALWVGAVSFAVKTEAASLTLMSMNLWGAGANANKSIDETVAVIKASQADIIAAQETVPEPDPCEATDCTSAGVEKSRAKEIAAALGYFYHEFKHNQTQHWADAVFSKFPFGKETPNGSGVEIFVNGEKIIVYSMNLNDAPYPPYQLLSIPYGDFPNIKTEAEAIKYSKIARGPAFKLVAADIKSAADARAQFVMGDFNEPSHLDWTEAAAKAKLHPIAVKYPFSMGLAKLGFIDSYRAIYKDPVAKPGFTWSPNTAPDDPNDHHDRIDFIMVRGKGVTITSAAIVGEKSPEADIVITPWTSDHRATLAKVTW